MTEELNAYKDLTSRLKKGEVVESIVFGDWGWGGYNESEEPPVPLDKRGILLTLEEAKPYMEGWSFFGGYGSPNCYAAYIWTNQRVMWVTQYDGSTALDSAPRNPVAMSPRMPGG